MSMDLVAPLVEALNEWSFATSDELLMESRGRAPRASGGFAAEMFPLRFHLGAVYEIEIHSGKMVPSASGPAGLAVFIREGTGAHEQYARGGAMVFPVSGGDMIFTSSASHPAHAPNPWAQEVLSAVGDVALARLDEAIQARWNG